MLHAYARLADDEKYYVRRTDLALPAGKPMVAVSESGFFKLVLRSDKPEALAFQEWVTRAVLPGIRRSGGYRLAGTAPEAVEEGTVTEPKDKQGGCVNSPQKSSSRCGRSIKQSPFRDLPYTEINLLIFSLPIILYHITTATLSNTLKHFGADNKRHMGLKDETRCRDVRQGL